MARKHTFGDSGLANSAHSEAATADPTPVDQVEEPVEAISEPQVDPEPAPYGVGGVYRSIGGGKRVRIG